MQADTVVDARKQAYAKKDALRIAHEADQIYIAKGTKVVHLDMQKDKPGDDQLAALLLGPTGNLRAPAIRQGKKLMVGFHEETYARLFG